MNEKEMAPGNLTAGENRSIYGDKRDALEQCLKNLEKQIDDIRNELTGKLGMDPVEHVLGRIKSEESMREKCRRKALPETPDSALHEIHDSIGIRIVCAFVDDIYLIRDALRDIPGIELFEEKDYIRHAKPNGYRSLHMILRVHQETGEYLFAELQLRTISMDTWAALEHHMKYKKDIGGNSALIVSELKRCADELAATDASMQTIRDMINGL